MDPSRTSKFRVAASTLGLVSLGGAPLRAVSRLFRESDGKYARVRLVDGEIVSTASASADRHQAIVVDFQVS